MPFWEALIVLLLILLNGLLAMSELAIVSSRRARLQHLAARGHEGARVALRLIEHPARFLATVQVGRDQDWDPWIAPAVGVVLVGVTFALMQVGLRTSRLTHDERVEAGRA